MAPFLSEKVSDAAVRDRNLEGISDCSGSRRKLFWVSPQSILQVPTFISSLPFFAFR